MARNLTKRQNEVLEFLREAQRRTGYMPSTREIQRHFQFASQTAAMSHLRALERKGVIQRQPNKARAVAFAEHLARPELLTIPIHGHIAAGLTQNAEAGLENALYMDQQVLGIEPYSSIFALRVRGDSMIEAHICDGDLAIFEQREPKHRDIVAALIDGETTLKRYMAERGRSPYLKAENASYPDLIPVVDLNIQGILVALIRKIR